jgi:hypothetical protein
MAACTCGASMRRCINVALVQTNSGQLLIFLAQGITMKLLLAAIALLGLLLAGTVRLSAQEPKPAPATVTLTATVTGMSRLDAKKVELRLEGKGSLLRAPHVLVDETRIKVNPFGRKPVAFTGQLTTKDVVIGRTGSFPGRNITAKALYLIATAGAEINDDNKAQFPAPGLARAEGKIVTGSFAAGKDSKCRHAIANGDQPILLLGKDGEPLAEVPTSGTVRAIGRLRVADNGALVLDVESIERDGRPK